MLGLARIPFYICGGIEISKSFKQWKQVSITVRFVYNTDKTNKIHLLNTSFMLLQASLKINLFLFRNNTIWSLNHEISCLPDNIKQVQWPTHIISI